MKVKQATRCIVRQCGISFDQRTQCYVSMLASTIRGFTLKRAQTITRAASRTKSVCGPGEAGIWAGVSIQKQNWFRDYHHDSKVSDVVSKFLIISVSTPTLDTRPPSFGRIYLIITF